VLAAGKWQASATADVSNPALGDVSCTSATACTAVGTQTTGWPPSTLAERWDGGAWDDQATPDPGGGGNLSLNGVSCYAANGCVSAGWYSQSGRVLPLAQTWNGSTWSSMSVPTPSGTPASTMLLDVACTAASSCFAVGSSSASGNFALVEHWNGSAWSLQTAPLPSGAVGGTLRGISCTSASACTAVGTYQTDPGWISHPLVLRWNGSAWSVQLSAPPAGATKATIDDVSCYSASGCVAVGDQSTSSGWLPLAMRWDGSSWTVETAARPAGSSHVYLESVSCATEGSCKAVGKAQFDSGHSEPYALASE
jgi:hypothetical protein